MPVDHHPVPAVAGVELRHQVRLPGPEPLGVRRRGGGRSPPGGVPGGEGLIHHRRDGAAQVVAGDVRGAGAAQRPLVLTMVAGGDHLLDAHVRPKREQAQQQPSVQGRLGDGLAGGHRDELGAEPGEQRGVLEDVEQVDGAPPALHLALECSQVLRLGQRLQLRHADPGLALAGHDPHPARGALRHRHIEPVQGLAHPGTHPVHERVRLHRLLQRRVVHVPVVLEIARQVGVGIAPLPGPLHVDLPPAQGLAQCDEHAQLIGDALHPPRGGVGDGLGPGLGHHPLDRHPLGSAVELLGPLDLGVASQQLDRLHHRPVGGVVTAERQRGQQRGEHPSVVVGVGAAQLVAHPLGHRLLRGHQLPRQLAQRLLPARDRTEDHLGHRPAGLGQGGVHHPAQDALLARHRGQLTDQLLLHPLLRAGVDSVDEADQQLHQAVDQLGLPGPAQRGQQGVAHRLGALGEVGGVHPGRARAPGGHDLLRYAPERLVRQPQGLNGLELVDLLQQGFQPQRPGVGLHGPQHALGAQYPALEPVADARAQAGHHAGGEGFLEPAHS
ncbi:hypothetical protein BQ8420_16415 [Nocardiopsis sp. JB363]|nr:hypothetical protein BQ8420_16415 [Nocardiopsis sp. JB363]